MASKTIYFALLLIALSLVPDNVQAGWKFWKKKDDTTTTTTVAPGIAEDPKVGVATTAAAEAKPAAEVNSAPAVNSNPSSTGGNANSNNGPASGAPSTGVRGAIAGVASPGLAIGVSNTGENIRNNARPQKPNPGTEVGLDISGRKPAVRPGTGGNTGQGYRDWAADLTGAGEGSRQPAKLPSQGPALSAGGTGQQQPVGVSRPASSTNTAAADIGQQQPESRLGTPTNDQSSPALVLRPGSPIGSFSSQPSGQGNKPVGTVTPAKPNNQATGASDGSHVSTLHVGSLYPGQSRPGSPSSGYESPGSAPGSPVGGSSPTGGKSWAEVVGSGGNSKPGSPTPPPRPASGQPAQSVHPGQAKSAGRPTSVGNPSGQATSGQTAGAGLGGRIGTTIAGGAAASTIAAGPANAGGKVYSSNPTYSKGNKVTDEDLEKLAEALFIKDSNNANRHITLNLQKQTTASNTGDQAPLPLLTVNPEALQIPTINKVITIYDNYKLDSRINEYISPAQRQEESLLVDTFLSTNVMSTAMRFLADKSFIRKDYHEYKDTLRRIWFNLYSRGDGKIGSSGFEHVFLTELKLGTEVSGLHNWIYFNAEELARRADYLGYIKKVDLGDKAAIVKIHTKFNNIDKPVTTMFIGTSPELEMALYTVCFFTRQDQPCRVSLGGTKFNIVTYRFKYRGKDLIGSAYPDI